jgi:hypothetical protein
LDSDSWWEFNDETVTRRPGMEGPSGEVLRQTKWYGGKGTGYDAKRDRTVSAFVLVYDRIMKSSSNRQCLSVFAFKS